MRAACVPVPTRAQSTALSRSSAPRQIDRTPETEPSLAEMTTKALAALTPVLALTLTLNLTLILTLTQPNPDPDPDPNRARTLTLTRTKALELLSAEGRGFFLLVEGSKIGTAAGANDAAAHVREVLAFDEAVGVVLRWAQRDGQTLVVATANHETGGLSLGRGVVSDEQVRVRLSLATGRLTLARTLALTRLTLALTRLTRLTPALALILTLSPARSLARWRRRRCARAPSPPRRGRGSTHPPTTTRPCSRG